MQYVQVDPITWLIFNPEYYNYKEDGLRFVPVLAIVGSEKEARDFIDEGYKGGLEGKTVVQFKPKAPEPEEVFKDVKL